MILNICPNPSIDCTVELEQLNIGRLNRIANKTVTYSGKALNSAIGISRLGGDSYATGFMYENDGNLFVQRLNNEGVKNTFVWNSGSVRINYKVVDNKSMLTEINDIGEKVSIEKQRELLELVSNVSKNASVVVISGSLPQGVDNSYYPALLNAVKGNAKKIVDTEGDKLLSSLSCGVYLAKPNLSELENAVKTRLETKTDMIKACQKLIDLGAQNVLLSLGRDGAIYTNGTTSYYCKSASVAVNSTVGAGDSMVAAASLMIENGADNAEILRCAVAAGTASITTSGTNLFYRDKFEEIYSKLKVEKI
ncbi:MAG: 1-phosphofructokinase family hexose kinase [Clostridia bacterium]|nr:1-phosphofructokinase family hexose kinase [Clostridia bacterium]